VYPITPPERFYEAATQIFRAAWLDSDRGLRAPNRAMVMRRTLEAMGVPDELINVDACLRAYDWQPVGGVAAFPDAMAVLPTLVQHGIKIGMITNTDLPMWMRDRELEAFGLLTHFADCRFSAGDVGYLKPHPAIFEMALYCMGVRVDEAIFVGDNPEADIAGAQSIGMRAVLRVTNPTPPLISGLIIPDGAINTLHDLLPLLDGWYPGWRGGLAASSEEAVNPPQPAAEPSIPSNPVKTTEDNDGTPVGNALS
jgi:FMN phosphatase YigB (HAD superfamily)